MSEGLSRINSRTVSADIENVQPESLVSQSQPDEYSRENDRYETSETTFSVPEHSSRLAEVWQTWPTLVLSVAEKTELRIGGSRLDETMAVTATKRGQDGRDRREYEPKRLGKKTLALNALQEITTGRGDVKD